VHFNINETIIMMICMFYLLLARLKLSNLYNQTQPLKFGSVYVLNTRPEFALEEGLLNDDPEYE